MQRSKGRNIPPNLQKDTGPETADKVADNTKDFKDETPVNPPDAGEKTADAPNKEPATEVSAEPDEEALGATRKTPTDTDVKSPLAEDTEYFLVRPIMIFMALYVAAGGGWYISPSGGYWR